MDQQPNSPAKESIFQEEEFSMEGYDKHIRKARITLFVLGGIQLLGLTTVMPLDDDPVRIATAVIIILIGAIFVALGFWTKKKPYSAILTALIIYAVMIALDAIAQPATLLQGWLIKIIIILILILGLGNARETQRMMTAFGKNK